ncbi:MAG: hypothetical protein V3W44_07315 [Dehalococcoidales bacterium]
MTKRITDEMLDGETWDMDSKELHDLVGELRTRVRELETILKVPDSYWRHHFIELEAKYNALREAVLREAGTVDDIAGGYNPGYQLDAGIPLAALREIRDRLKALTEGGGESRGYSYDGMVIKLHEALIRELYRAGNKLAEYLERALPDMESFGSKTDLEREDIKKWKELVGGINEGREVDCKPMDANDRPALDCPTCGKSTANYPLGHVLQSTRDNLIHNRVCPKCRKRQEPKE